MGDEMRRCAELEVRNHDADFLLPFLGTVNVVPDKGIIRTPWRYFGNLLEFPVNGRFCLVLYMEPGAL